MAPTAYGTTFKQETTMAAKIYDPFKEFEHELTPIGNDENGDPCYDISEFLRKLKMTPEQMELILEKAQAQSEGKVH